MRVGQPMRTSGQCQKSIPGAAPSPSLTHTHTHTHAHTHLPIHPLHSIRHATPHSRHIPSPGSPVCAADCRAELTGETDGQSHTTRLRCAKSSREPSKMRRGEGQAQAQAHARANHGVTGQMQQSIGFRPARILGCEPLPDPAMNPPSYSRLGLADCRSSLHTA